MKIGYIQITRECNQKCIICSNPPTDRTVDFETIKKEIRDLKKNGYAEVILTGGEPTLNPDLAEIIRYAMSQKIEPRIITNGQKIADINYLKKLKKAGLEHLHLSVYSHRPEIQAKISQNKNSLKNIKKALENIKRLSENCHCERAPSYGGASAAISEIASAAPRNDKKKDFRAVSEKIGRMGVDINITLNKYNASSLFQTVKWLVENYSFLKHFVFNNLDPHMNRVEKNPDTIPALTDFELPLYQSLKFLESKGKTFRVERVPLCYLPEFEWCSTETRKIVKKEDRTVYFLDQRGKFRQENFFYQKAECCKVCFLNKICAGLYGGDKFYDIKALYPVFVNPKNIINRILSKYYE